MHIDFFRQPPEKLPLQETSGLVVLGGPMNADEVDRYPFLKLDVQWIQEAIEARLPLLGICLGSQLMAKALGAWVYKNPVKEIGWYPIEWLPAASDDPLFAGSGTATLFQWHGDTFDLPPGAVRLARGSSCQNQAFRWGSNAYALQFHAEMTAAMIDRWLGNGEESGELAAAAYIDPAEIRKTTPLLLPQMQELAADLFGRFAGLCLNS